MISTKIVNQVVQQGKEEGAALDRVSENQAAISLTDGQENTVGAWEGGW